jgi:hypothetical protein
VTSPNRRRPGLQESPAPGKDTLAKRHVSRGRDAGVVVLRP